MADLATKYMGIDLKSPFVVGACSLSKHVDSIKKAEELGAGALVMKSLFEEQIQLEQAELEEALQVGAGAFPEALSHLPAIEHAGPKEHLYWVEQARKAVEMPLIASLNAVQPGSWVDWAKQLEEAGANGLELNLFSLGAQPDQSAADIEKRMLEIVQAVLDRVSIPVSAKLSPSFTSLAHFAQQLDQRGVKALVLFNRFFQPDINAAQASLIQRPKLSRPEDALLPLRWIGLLSGRVKADLIANSGIHDADAAVKMLLAGAQAVQVVSALYIQKLDYLKRFNDGLARWMDEHDHASIEAFRGKLSQGKLADPAAYERAQYIKLLLGFD